MLASRLGMLHYIISVHYLFSIVWLKFLPVYKSGEVRLTIWQNSHGQKAEACWFGSWWRSAWPSTQWTKKFVTQMDQHWEGRGHRTAWKMWWYNCSCGFQAFSFDDSLERTGQQLCAVCKEATLVFQGQARQRERQGSFGEPSHLHSSFITCTTER